ncbi:MAG: methionine--tRNA ligase [Anaerolineae bacterium]|nr:methionine--tRNA ligase [Anaerolineae bacterium]
MTTPPEHIHVSVAWPYANGDLHVGHLAGAYLPSDIFARYHRLKGNRVLMVSGSDSHGTPISVEADKRGIPARQVFEHYHERFLQTQQKLGISYDLFTHTDTENHHRIAQDIFLLLLERGYLYKEEQELLYSELENRFLPDRYVEGTCYICGYDSARGDQCDNCGNLMDATKLINPHNRSNPDDKLIVRTSEHYFLDLSQTSDALLRYLETHQAHWRPNVLSFTRNLITQGVEEGLRGRAYTRDLDWGVAVPLEGWNTKRIYVWFEAVNGYFTASVEWANNHGQPDAWKDWWYNPSAKIYNFIGKDNIPFHTVIWPAMLIGIDGIYNQGSDTKLNLPYDVPANEFMNIEGKQFSKSRNWAIWLPDILERYQPDAIRYYVAMTFPESRDSDFDWEGFLSRVNNELVAAWGNLVNRVLGFAYKRFDGKVPEYDVLTAADQALIARAEAGFETIGALLEQVKLRDALVAAMDIVREANGYLTEHEPWKRIKDDPADAARTVYTALRVIDNLKMLLAPFLPFSAQTLHEYLGYDGQLFGSLTIEDYQESTRAHQALVYDGRGAIGTWAKSELQPGQALREPAALFTKLDPEIIAQERAYLGAPREEHEILSD